MHKAASDTATRKKTILLSSLGGGLEFYDFVIFAVFAGAIGNNFFPQDDAVAKLIGAFSLFAVGYLVRPLGGIIFSHYGDRIGRKKSFSLSISIMASSTLLMSIVPSYHSWGISATLLFIALRVLQGISIGGEIPGAITFICEHISDRPGMACGVLFFFLNIGMLLAYGVYAILTHSFDAAFLNHYGWRLAFAFGGMLAIVSYYLRLHLHETQAFNQLKGVHDYPFLTLLKHHKSRLLIGVSMAGLGAIIVSIFFLYMVGYMETLLDYPAQVSSRLNMVALLTLSVMSTVFATLSDHFFSRRSMALTASLILLFSSYFIYQSLIAHTPHLAMILCFTAIISALYVGTFPCLLAELFPVGVRFSGVAVSYNIGFAIFGGLSPLVASLLIKHYQVLTAPAWLVMAACVPAILALMSFEHRRIKAYTSEEVAEGAL